MSPKDQLDAWQAEHKIWRRQIHAQPELGFEEQLTSDFVAEKLTEFGLQVHRYVGKTGVVASLSAGDSSRAIGLRADMDALPIEEQNTFPHSSKHEGVMHACGHDGHTVMLLAAARYLSQHKNFDGSVHFIFQPAEEAGTASGAQAMIDDGLFEKFPMDAVYALHNMPLFPVGKFAVRTGPYMAGVDSFDIHVRGRGSHAAMPHESVDPILVGSQIVSSLHTIVSRSLDPMQTAVLGVTQFHSGDNYNVIPESATLSGDVRTYSQDVQSQIKECIEQLSKQVAASYGAEAEVIYHYGQPPTINTDKETVCAGDAAAKVLGEENVVRDMSPVMASDDFGIMLNHRPGCYMMVGNGDQEGSCMVHNPNFDFNDEAIPYGAAFWVELVQSSLNQ